MPASSGGAFKLPSTWVWRQRTRDQVIRRQMLFWFGLPVAAAVLCSLGILVFFIGINYEDFTAYLPLSRMFLLSALTYGSFLLLLLCYFTATYHLFRRAMAAP